MRFPAECPLFLDDDGDLCVFIGFASEFDREISRPGVLDVEMLSGELAGEETWLLPHLNGIRPLTPAAVAVAEESRRRYFGGK